MRPQKNDPGACDTGANKNCVLDSAAYSKNASDGQGRMAAAEGVSRQWMTGDIGPVHVLARHGCPPPRVAVETRPDKAFVFIQDGPWGWDIGLREFLDPASPSILRYAQRLALKLREAALIEQGRRVRNRELAQQEREAMLASRRDGGR